MRVLLSASPVVSWLLIRECSSFSGLTFSQRHITGPRVLGSTIQGIETDWSYERVNKLTYRELKRELELVSLPTEGSTGSLRNRLLEKLDLVQIRVVKEEMEVETPEGISFKEEIEPGHMFESNMKEIMGICAVRHWKKASRKLKQAKKRYPEYAVPNEVYNLVLDVCCEDRLHGARAAQTVRKIIENMSDEESDEFYSVPEKLGNECVVNCLGMGPLGRHDDCGGIDVALAIMSSLERMGFNYLNVETYSTVVSALARDGSFEEALALLRVMIVDRGFTPQLSTIADVAMAGAKDHKDNVIDEKEDNEAVLQVLSLAKASGYILDNIASVEAGRNILAAGLIAANKLENVALGLRLLTAAEQAEGCAPDKGDVLVTVSSNAAQKASNLIHKKAVGKASRDGNWKLAVKVVELMNRRGLIPTTLIWRQLVTVCAKSEKSRKATAILKDWLKLSNEGLADTPPLAIFNMVVNCCEICREEELTLVVLELMRKTHNTDGNIITFNIALKRLAKIGQTRACEGIIVSMLQSGLEPTVVTFTTAIAACASQKDKKDGTLAYEWLNRMKSRAVEPNFHTYNTALAACEDGTLEGTITASKIATMMLNDVDREVRVGFKGKADYKSVLPDTYTKKLAIELNHQLRDCWRRDDINIDVAKATLRVPLLKLVDFNITEAKQHLDDIPVDPIVVEEAGDIIDADQEIVYARIQNLHKEGRRNIEV